MPGGLFIWASSLSLDRLSFDVSFETILFPLEVFSINRIFILQVKRFVVMGYVGSIVDIDVLVIESYVHTTAELPWFVAPINTRSLWNFG